MPAATHTTLFFVMVKLLLLSLQSVKQGTYINPTTSAAVLNAGVAVAKVLHTYISYAHADWIMHFIHSNLDQI